MLNKQRVSLLRGIAVCGVGAMLLTSCSAGPAGQGGGNGGADSDSWVSSTPAGAEAVDNINWNIILEPTILDSAQVASEGEGTPMALMCESLLKIDGDYTISDGLASVETNEDRTKLVYTINDKATFWDGSPVTGEDAAYSLTRLWKPTDRPVFAEFFTSVTSIEATGEREVTVTLDHADILLERLLATVPGQVGKKAFIEEHGDTYGAAGVGPMCSGAFKYDSWAAGSELKLVRNDDYWGDEKPLVAAITFTFLQGDATQANALTGGAIDGMYQPPYSALEQLRKTGQVVMGKSLTQFVIYPTRKPGPLQDPRIRRALYLALNRQAVADTAFAGAAKPAHSILSQYAYQDIDPAKSEGAGGSSADLEEAKRLVEEAGSPKETINFVAATEITESMNQTLMAMAEAGKEIGLNTEFKPVTLGQFYSLFREPDEGWKDTDADAFGSIPSPYVPDPMAAFKEFASPDLPGNYSGYENAEASELIESAMRESDVAKRNELIAEIDKVLFEELPWIPIVEVAQTTYLKNDITGVVPTSAYQAMDWALLLGQK